MTQLPKDGDKKKEDEGLKLSNELLEALAKFKQIELEDFQMDVKELELIFEPGMAGQIMPKLKLPAALAAQAENPLQCFRCLSYHQSKHTQTK